MSLPHFLLITLINLAISITTTFGQTNDPRCDYVYEVALATIDLFRTSTQYYCLSFSNSTYTGCYCSQEYFTSLTITANYDALCYDSPAIDSVNEDTIEAFNATCGTNFQSQPEFTLLDQTELPNYSTGCNASISAYNETIYRIDNCLLDSDDDVTFPEIIACRCASAQTLLDRRSVLDSTCNLPASSESTLSALYNLFLNTGCVNVTAPSGVVAAIPTARPVPSADRGGSAEFSSTRTTTSITSRTRTTSSRSRTTSSRARATRSVATQTALSSSATRTNTPTIARTLGPSASSLEAAATISSANQATQTLATGQQSSTSLRLAVHSTWSLPTLMAMSIAMISGSW